MLTKGYGGHKYSKSIHVTTNDPKHQDIELKISGDVQTFANVIPKSVYLSGTVGEPVSQIVKIIPIIKQTEEPFKILKVASLNDADIQYSLKEKDEAGQKIYELTIENKRQTEGRYFDTISIITDKSDQAPLTIYVRGNIRSKSDQKAEGANETVQKPESPQEEGHSAAVKEK